MHIEYRSNDDGKKSAEEALQSCDTWVVGTLIRGHDGEDLVRIELGQMTGLEFNKIMKQLKKHVDQVAINPN